MIGIYAIFKKSDDECLYVGQSADIYGRIKSHFKGNNARFNKEEHYGQMIEQHFINDKNYRLEREVYWINELNPKLNVRRDRHYISGEKNPMYGKNCEDYMTPDAVKVKRKKQSEAIKGIHRSDETKEKMSHVKTGENNPSYGKKWINNDTISKLINHDDLDKYIQDGWKLGRLPWKKNL